METKISNTMFKNKKAQVLRNYIVMILIAMLSFSMIVFIINDMNVQYPVNASTNFPNTPGNVAINSTDTICNSASINKSAYDIQQGIADTKPGDLWGQLGILLKVVVFTGNQLVSAIPCGTYMITHVGTGLGIPAWVFGVFISILIIIIVFAIISAWHRTEL
jgi:hypothetical protein